MEDVVLQGIRPWSQREESNLYGSLRQHRVYSPHHIHSGLLREDVTLIGAGSFAIPASASQTRRSTSELSPEDRADMI